MKSFPKEKIGIRKWVLNIKKIRGLLKMHINLSIKIFFFFSIQIGEEWIFTEVEVLILVNNFTIGQAN